MITVDAGYRDGAAGLGVWIPALGTGVAFGARARDNNEAETFAILLGVVVARLMALHRAVVYTDSLLNVQRLNADSDLKGALSVARDALAAEGVTLEWRPREHTGLADFFATLALSGKSLIATTANAKNPEHKFRPLLRVERNDRTPVKDVRLTWLALPGAPKAPFDPAEFGLATLAPGLTPLLGDALPVAEFRVLAAHFFARALSAGRAARKN